MTDQVTLSVTVLSYNNAQYIEDCLASIEKQGIDSYEVFVVDDVSSDNSVEVINKYISGKPQFHLIEKTENSGGAVSSQIGVEKSTGKYCAIIDSDDIVADGAYKQLIKRIEEDGSDFAAGMPLLLHSGYLYGFMTSEAETSVFAENTVISDDKGKAKYARTFSYWNCLFKTDFLKENNIHMQSGLLIADRPFLYDAIYKADKISIDRTIVYYWRKKNNPENQSLTDQNVEYRMIADRCDSFETQVRITLENLDKGGELNLGMWEISFDRLFYPLTEILQQEDIDKDFFREVCDRYRFLLTEYAGFFSQLLDGGSISTLYTFYTMCLLNHDYKALLAVADEEDIASKVKDYAKESDKPMYRKSLVKDNGRMVMERIAREGDGVYVYVKIPNHIRNAAKVSRVNAITRIYKLDRYELDYDNDRSRFNIKDLPESIYYFSMSYSVIDDCFMQEIGRSALPMPELLYEDKDYLVMSSRRGGNPLVIMRKNRYTFLGKGDKVRIFVNNDDGDISKLFFYNAMDNIETDIKMIGPDLYELDIKNLPKGRNVLLAKHSTGTCSTVNRRQFTNSAYQMKSYAGLFKASVITIIK